MTTSTGSVHTFTAVLEAARGGGAVVRVPPEVATALGGLKQMRVLGTLKGIDYRSSTMPYRGGLYLGVHKATREMAPRKRWHGPRRRWSRSGQTRSVT